MAARRYQWRYRCSLLRVGLSIVSLRYRQGRYSVGVHLWLLVSGSWYCFNNEVENEFLGAFIIRMKAIKKKCIVWATISGKVDTIIVDMFDI